ncbi:MAG: hypothetical protein LBU11_01780 [Zoogloeaceae bacterium]|nr:hypothetical protein [Zoogloeaceae bacterium]
MFLGLFPASDEGYYAYAAQQIHHSLVNGQGIPDSGGLSLYPMLCSWVFSLQYNPMIALRLIDLGVAIVMAFLWYKVLARICNNNTGAACITFIFTFTLNQFGFIESGFKNSITVAFVPLLLALYIGIGAVQEKESGNAWWMAGALTALSIVFRETFAPFALVGLVSVFIAQGRKAALQFFVGGMAAGIALVGEILLARGGIAETIAHYRAAGIVFDAVSGLRLKNFYSYGLQAAYSSSIALAFSALSIMVSSIVFFFRRDRSLFLTVVFWLSFIGVALFEPVVKVCYPYHFTILFPGLSGLCALALREIIRLWPVMKWAHGKVNNILVAAGILLSTIWLYFSCSMLAMIYWPFTLETLVAAPGGKWPEKFVHQSELLFIAAEIEKVIPEKGTLSIIMHMQSLYPLTGRFPPSYRLNDLSTTAILLRFSVPAIRQALLDCAPDVIVFTTKEDRSIFESILATEIYEPVVKIPFTRKKMDHFDGVMIFRKTQETACLEAQGMADWL